MALVSFLARPKPVFLCSETRPNGNACHAGVTFCVTVTFCGVTASRKGTCYGMSKRCRQQREPICYWSSWSSFPVWGQNFLSFNAKDAVDPLWSEEIYKPASLSVLLGQELCGLLKKGCDSSLAIDRSRSKAWTTYKDWLTSTINRV